jgi:hypothetical protein
MWIWKHVESMAPGQRTPNFKTWVEDVRKLRRIDNRSIEDIKAVFLWAHNDDFWKTNIRSPAKLRAKFDDLNAKRINAKPTKMRHGNGNSRESFAEKNYTDGARLGVLAGVVELES